MASHSDKPVIVIIHGAFHAPIHFKRLIAPLRAEGFTVLAPGLASAGPDDSVLGKTIADDVACIAAITQRYLDAGRELVLVPHSYGGKPTTQFCGGRSVKERERLGLKGGVRAVVYMCALAASKKSESLKVAPRERQLAIAVKDETGLLTPNEIALDRFYSDDVPDEATRRDLANFLGFHSFSALLGTPNPDASEIETDKYYALCTRDQAILPADQRLMAEKCGAEIVELDAGHSPFLVDEHIVTLVELIKRAAGTS